MAVFGSYSKYYNLLYKDKDYAGEVAYLSDLVKRLSDGGPEMRSLMELGCGTGNHAFLFAKEGVAVCGVDMSADMIAEAKTRLSRESALLATPEFHEGDIRSVRVNDAKGAARKFDVVFSLFHVISYQTTNDDLIAAFETARAHLKPGGLFIFDVWYGPAVLTDPPAVRVKRLADDSTEVTRLAEPVLRAERNLVDVNYEVQIRAKGANEVETIRETHHMRYLFGPELEFLLKAAGFAEIVHSEEWMTRAAAGTNTWGVVFAAKA